MCPADFIFSFDGSIGLLMPCTQLAKDWVHDNVDTVTYFGPSVVVEHRYINDLLEGIQRDGLTLA